jgi:hypothetical protein
MAEDRLAQLYYGEGLKSVRPLWEAVRGDGAFTQSAVREWVRRQKSNQVFQRRGERVVSPRWCPRSGTRRGRATWRT